MNKGLLILGAGGYGRVVRETAESMGVFDKIDFLDDNSDAAIGKLSDYELYKEMYNCAFVAMGRPELREKWLNALRDAGFELPCIVSPVAYISPSAILEEGCIVEAMAIVNTGAKVHRGSLVCAGSVINHDAVVMDICQIDCGAVVSAGAVVPKGTKVLSCTVFSK